MVINSDNSGKDTEKSNLIGFFLLFNQICLIILKETNGSCTEKHWKNNFYLDKTKLK